MFEEPPFSGERRGWIEVICGSMFSGKTEELIRRLKRAQIAHQRVGIFKPRMDLRYDENSIVSHDDKRFRSIAVDDSREILLQARGMDVIGIDEAQFFDENLPGICSNMALDGIRVIVAGLDMDYLGRPFGPVPDMLAEAEYITKLHAICVRCGHIANYSYRKSEERSKVLLGERDQYEPRCRVCYNLS